jgi:hypothetical protein
VIPALGRAWILLGVGVEKNSKPENAAESPPSTTCFVGGDLLLNNNLRVKNII